MARVFVTGASGLVGGALAARLLERGDEVVALARSDAAAAALGARGASVVRGDAADEAALAAAMAGCSLAFHVAGINTLCPSDRAEMLRVNVLGPQAAVRAAARAGVARLVVTSSATTLGEAAGTVGREDSPHRGWYLSTYERSKHQGELAARAAARGGRVELVCVNPSSVQGAGRSGGTARIILAYLNGRLPAFVRTRISVLDLDDCTEGHLLAAERGRAGERYVLNGASLTSREALDLLARLSGARHRVRMLPPPLARAVGAVVEAPYRAARRPAPVCREMVRTILHGHDFDGSRAARELGLGYTPVAETFRRMIEWAAAEGLVPGLSDIHPQ